MRFFGNFHTGMTNISSHKFTYFIITRVHGLFLSTLLNQIMAIQIQ